MENARRQDNTDSFQPSSSVMGRLKRRKEDNLAPQGVSGEGDKVRASQSHDAAQALLKLERDARLAASEAELGYLIVNGSRASVPYRQAILLLKSGGKGFKTFAISSLSAVDRNSTFVRWLEKTAKSHLAGESAAKVVSVDVRQHAMRDDVDARTYPFPMFAFVPLAMRDGTVFGHLLLTREQGWDEPSLVAATRLCETYAHAWESLSGPRKLQKRMRSKTLLVTTAIASVIAFGFLPVPLTVLAPAEVTAAQPYVVAAPIDGVIDEIAVEPNTMVEAGAPLFRYTDTDLRNKVQLAGQAVSVAEARLTQSLRTSFSDPKAKRELSIAQSELELKAGEYEYARDLLANSKVTAPRGGLVLFADAESWTGKPVSTGERIMRIARPNDVEITIDLPVSDAVVLQQGARVQMYLDSDPLNSIRGELTRASFHATPDAAGVLSYQLKAKFNNVHEAPRIGLRGTAQVHGEKVSLAYFLFRKPLAAIRQWTGM